MNGVIFDGTFVCTPRCVSHSTLKTQYRAWQEDVRILTDYALGPFTFTPSVAGFYGQTRDNQDGTQTTGFPALVIAAYAVNSTLRWSDLGAKLGGDLSVMPNARTKLAVGGSVGFAVRDVSFDANDSITPMNGYVPPVGRAPTSSVSQSVTRKLWRSCRNAEARINYQFTTAIAIKGFVGVNYDSRVPGVAGPSYGGYGNPLFKSPVPAHIFYSGETSSYYVGGGTHCSLRTLIPHDACQRLRQFPRAHRLRKKVIHAGRARGLFAAGLVAPRNADHRQRRPDFVEFMPPGGRSRHAP